MVVHSLRPSSVYTCTCIVQYINTYMENTFIGKKKSNGFSFVPKKDFGWEGRERPFAVVVMYSN